MKSAADPANGLVRQRRASVEGWLVVALLLAFVTANVVTSARYPFVWIDEVMYADPAVNLLQGNGFNSSAWYVQHANEFWAGNVPLHPFLLYLWMKVFGFSILSVRSINYLYTVASCWLIWLSCRRLSLIPSARLRLLSLCLILGGYSVAFSYRSGRPDCLPMFLSALLAFAYTFGSTPAALVSSFLLGAALPWSGLQSLPLLGAGGVLLLLFLGRPFLPRLLVTWSGAAAGLGSLALFYSHHGVFDQFVKTSRQHTAVGFFGMLAHGQFRHSNLTPKDFSFVPLFVLALLFVLWQRKEGTLKLRSLAVFGPVYSVTLSLALLISGKFPTYYGWMTYIPLSVCICGSLPLLHLSRIQSVATRLLLAAAVTVGLGLHVAAAACDWRERDYAKVEALVRKNVTPSDRVYGEFGTYYAAKTSAAMVYAPTYITAVLPEEKKRITVLILDPANLDQTVKVIGGEWVDTGVGLVPAVHSVFGTQWEKGFLSMQNYRLELYRRAR